MDYIELLVAIFPVFIICLYIYNRDKEKEPLTFLFKLIFFGILSSITVILLNSFFYATGIFEESIVHTNKDILMYSFFNIAIIEESSKFAFLFFSSYKSKYYDYTFDMIVYGVFISLGFALFENILYVFEYGVETGLQRAATAIVLHASCGVLMGLFLGKSKVKEINHKFSIIYKLLAIIIPTTIHAIYDFCALTNALEELIVVVIILLSTSILFVNYNRLTDTKLTKLIRKRKYSQK